MKKKLRKSKKKITTKNLKNEPDLLSLLTVDDKSSHSSCREFQLYEKQRDPVRAFNKKKKAKQSHVEKKGPLKIQPDILPSLSLRLVMGRHCEPYVYPPIEYQVPPFKGQKADQKKRRELAEKKRKHFCHFELLKVPSPTTTMQIDDEVLAQSPKISDANVFPQKTSVTKGAVYPTPQTSSILELHKPKSGIFVNVAPEQPQLPQEKELPIVVRPRRRSILREQTLSALYEGEEMYEEEFYMSVEDEEEIDIAAEEYLKQLRRKVSQTSANTSYNSKDLKLEEEISWERIAVISKLVQTFRRENEADRKSMPKKRYKKGTLQSHSFTKLKQKTTQDICFKLVAGTIHQGDRNYPEISRNNQGICMPIAAYCYTFLKDAKFWSEPTIDEILDIGNRLYLDSISSLHMHADQRDLKPEDLHKYVYIADKKIRFVIDDPDIVGYIRSTDRRVFNISKGLKLFLQRNVAGILQSTGLNVVIWKSGRKYMYFFDATPRATDLCQERTGTAVLAKFCKFSGLVTLLLDRTNLGNSAFTISPIIIKKVLGRHEKDEEIIVNERSNYNILNENKAVVQASFDLGDKCFEFTRNKQGVTMSVIALIYSRITPACNWRRRTVDKIMVIGNQLYLECAEAENNVEINLEDIPSGFSIGPYTVEIFIYANRFADLMYKKGVCYFEKCINEFFEKNTNGIVQIGKYTLAVWQQRNMYFIFDPYTRNNEAFKCRSGTGCVSMNANLATVVDTISSNFDNKDLIFHIHALKILKIYRDVKLAHMFPKGLTMSNIPIEAIKKTRIRKCKKKAVEKPVQIQPSEYALKKISASESPGPSLHEIDSTVASIQMGILPPLPLKLPPKSLMVTEGIEKELVADLDSPSLSDTQIEPKAAAPGKEEEEIMLMDLDNYDATMDELEMLGEEEEEYEGGGDYRGVMYTMRSTFSQVKSMSLDSYHRTRSAIVNTDLTYNYKILPSLELPIKYRPSDVEIPKYYISPSQELQKPTEYVNCEDGSQIISGTKNINHFTPDKDKVAPFMCVFGIALHEEMPINRWRSKSVDFVLKSGKELYDQHEEPYNKIEDFTLQFIENEYRINLEVLLDTYVGNDLFTNSIGVKIFKETLETNVFKKFNSAIVITPHFTGGILLFNSLFYLIDCYGGDAHGISTAPENDGLAYVARFRNIEELIVRMMLNKNKIDGEISLEYVRLVICVPIFSKPTDIDIDAKKKHDHPHGSAATISTTQSQELTKPNNFIDLPDNTQIVRGKSNIASYGDDVEFMAPFVSIMVACVGEKYSIVTWTKDIVDYVLQCGTELFKKSAVRFDQVSKILIPKVTLGSTDYNVEVDYLFDGFMKETVLEKALTKFLIKDYEWALIVTRYYSCAVCVKNYLYYMYDGFGCNEVGYGEGLSNTGVACLQRFKDLHSMVMRILCNKSKREFEDVVEHTKFVLSSCRAILIPPEKEVIRKDRKNVLLSDFDQVEGAEDEAKSEKKDDKEEKKKKVNKIGYQRKKKFEVIEGTVALQDRESSVGELKDDHFICITALLNVITTSMPKWDTKRVDSVLDQGKRIYMLAEDLNETNKRTIKNILVGSHFFDIIVKKVKIEDWKKNKTLEIGLNTVLRKRRFCIVQFQNCSYGIYKGDDGFFHLFDPYGFSYKQDENAEEEEEEDEADEVGEEGETDEEDDKTPKACWIKFLKDNKLKRYIRSNIVEKMENYSFYTFVVMSVRPAPKDVIISHKLNMFEVEKRPKGETMGKHFYEQEVWLRMYQLPWSLSNGETACGKPRDKQSSKWYNWDIEYVNDLFSLAGTIHQIDKQFEPDCRGKQTLTNMIMAIAMTNIYEFPKWNSAILNSILTNGNDYFKECIEDIEEENYELKFTDIKDNAGIFPYTFNVQIKPIVEGTMFLINEKKFNLYKALRYFFESYENRCGIVCGIKGDLKKYLGFGKIQESEYFLYDCQSYGMPMFWDNQGVSYILRCLTLNRLLYCLVTTLRGGDFYIFEVDTYNYQAVTN